MPWIAPFPPPAARVDGNRELTERKPQRVEWHESWFHAINSACPSSGSSRMRLFLPIGVSMNSGDVAWILAASALVCMMIPALALFYGGMVGSRRILNMMMMCFGGVSLV